MMKNLRNNSSTFLKKDHKKSLHKLSHNCKIILQILVHIRLILVKTQDNMIILMNIIQISAKGKVEQKENITITTLVINSWMISIMTMMNSHLKIPNKKTDINSITRDLHNDKKM